MHLKSSRGSASTLKFAKFPEPPSLWSKLQNCCTELIACSFESSRRNKYTWNVAKLSVIDTFKVICENEITATAILFFVYISKNIGNIVLSLSKSCFSCQKLSNEHTMGSVRQFWNFDPIIGMMYVWSWCGPPKWHPMSVTFRRTSSCYQRNKIKQETERFEDVGAFDAPYYTALCYLHISL